MRAPVIDAVQDLQCFFGSDRLGGNRPAPAAGLRRRRTRFSCTPLPGIHTISEIRHDLLARSGTLRPAIMKLAKDQVPAFIAQFIGHFDNRVIPEIRGERFHEIIAGLNGDTDVDVAARQVRQFANEFRMHSPFRPNSPFFVGELNNCPQAK